MTAILSERELTSIALALAGPNAGFSKSETAFLEPINPSSDRKFINNIRDSIRQGLDPLGESFSRIRSAKARRENGATFTPPKIIDPMLDWAETQETPSRVVDPGAGSGRFLLAAAKRFPNAHLVGIERDPLVALLLRANAAAHGVLNRAEIVVGDFRSVKIAKVDGGTLFIGNPPYVRHHDIEDSWKQWYAKAAASVGIRASRLAGLHLHFFFRTMQLANPNDFGAFVTSAEWLDVNYGTALRELLADGLGGTALHVLDPKVMPFADATTTAAITCFRVGKRSKTLKVRTVDRVSDLGNLSAGTAIPWSTLTGAKKWSTIFRPASTTPSGFVELGEICRVHRGQVTGGNEVWIAGPHASYLPKDVLVATITKARDLFDAGTALDDVNRLRNVIDIPPDLDALDRRFLPAIERFLKWAKSKGADQSYIAKHRRAWWSVGLKDPAPILCTYMARRPPAFVRNRCQARHINIAHGLYPREPMDVGTLDALTAWLRHNVSLERGRTYAGGLTKFEPKEVERIPVPRLENLPA